MWEQVPIPVAVDDHLGGRMEIHKQSKHYVMWLKWTMTMIQYQRTSHKTMIIQQQYGGS